ncbi:MAG: CDP-alcohol phosphatidyltransferase family protein [Candidatus Sumerlaeia bacterium]
MPSIYDVKPAFQNRLRPLSEHMVRAGFTANQVTLVALVMSILLGLLMAVAAPSRPVLLLLPIWLFARMALNAIDGMLAREHRMKSNLGALLNELGDVIADAALYLPLALWLTPVSRAAMVIVVVLGIVSELAGIAAVQIGATRRYDGPMGKSDRAFWLGALALLLMFGLPPGRLTALILLIMIVMLARTIYNRASRALAEAPPVAGD